MGIEPGLPIGWRELREHDRRVGVDTVLPQVERRRLQDRARGCVGAVVEVDGQDCGTSNDLDNVHLARIDPEQVRKVGDEARLALAVIEGVDVNGQRLTDLNGVISADLRWDKVYERRSHLNIVTHLCCTAA